MARCMLPTKIYINELGVIILGVQPASVHGLLTHTLREGTKNNVILSSVSISSESKPELKNVIVKLATETMLPRTLPFTVYNLECDILYNGNNIESSQPYCKKCIYSVCLDNTCTNVCLG